MTARTTPDQGQPRAGVSPVKAALFGLCPRCSSRTLFAGWTAFAKRCRTCGLDYARFDVGDGPAAFLIFAIGGLVVGLAIWLELAASPPWWLHALLWPALIFGTTVLGLRIAKAALLQAEHARGLGR